MVAWSTWKEKLKKEYEKWGLAINLEKTKYVFYFKI